MLKLQLNKHAKQLLTNETILNVEKAYGEGTRCIEDFTNDESSLYHSLITPDHSFDECVLELNDNINRYITFSA